MTWTKTGDEFADECWTLSSDAYRLHHEGLTWSNRKHLDGRLPKDEIHRWCKYPEAAPELTDRGWWEEDDTHYQIIHHIGYQPTAESVRRRSLANRENVQKRWAKKRSREKDADQPSDDQSYGSYNESQYESQYDGDGTGRDGEGLEKEPNYVSANRKKNNDFDSVPGNSTEREYAGYFAAEPPAFDADGYPIDNGEADR